MMTYADVWFATIARLVDCSFKQPRTTAILLCSFFLERKKGKKSVFLCLWDTYRQISSKGIVDQGYLSFTHYKKQSPQGLLAYPDGFGVRQGRKSAEE